MGYNTNPAPSSQATTVKPAAPTGDEAEDGARRLLGGARHRLVWAWHQSAMLQVRKTPSWP